MSTRTPKKKLSNMKTHELKEELMHYRETKPNLLKDIYFTIKIKISSCASVEPHYQVVRM